MPRFLFYSIFCSALALTEPHFIIFSRANVNSSTKSFCYLPLRLPNYRKYRILQCSNHQGRTASRRSTHTPVVNLSIKDRFPPTTRPTPHYTSSGTVQVLVALYAGVPKAIDQFTHNVLSHILLLQLVLAFDYIALRILKLD
jgi:hypothetical protein